MGQNFDRCIIKETHPPAPKKGIRKLMCITKLCNNHEIVCLQSYIQDFTVGESRNQHLSVKKVSIEATYIIISIGKALSQFIGSLLKGFSTSVEL